MDELLCVIELLIVTGPQHIIDKSFKVQVSSIFAQTSTSLMCGTMKEIGGNSWKTYEWDK